LNCSLSNKGKGALEDIEEMNEEKKKRKRREGLKVPLESFNSRYLYLYAAAKPSTTEVLNY